MSGAFFDSNILLYCIDRVDARRARASGLIAEGGTISVQCLNEFVSVARRKLAMPWDHVVEARDTIASLCPVVPVTVDVHLLGTRIAERYRLSVYHGMILAAALLAKCEVLYSEDMHHGLVVEGRLRIENPFHA